MNSKKINETFLKLGNELKELGYKVVVSKRQHEDNLITYLNVYDDDNNGLYLQFNYLPYEWQISRSIKPSIKKGSSVRVKTLPYRENYTFPIAAKELKQYFTPMYVDGRFNNLNKIL